VTNRLSRTATRSLVSASIVACALTVPLPANAGPVADASRGVGTTVSSQISSNWKQWGTGYYYRPGDCQWFGNFWAEYYGWEKYKCKKIKVGDGHGWELWYRE
jgi:hypothetical protein